MKPPVDTYMYTETLQSDHGDPWFVRSDVFDVEHHDKS